MKSDTPRTDAEQEHVANAYNDWVCQRDEALPALYIVPADLARKLERELSAANARIAKLTKALSLVFPRCEYLHHEKRHQHVATAHCPVEMLFEELQR